MKSIAILLAALAMSAAPAAAAVDEEAVSGALNPSGGLGNEKQVVVHVIPSHTQVIPGQTFNVALELDIAKGWVYYSDNPGARADILVLPASITPVIGSFKAGKIIWPQASSHQFALGDKTYSLDVFEGREAVIVPITVPEDAKLGTHQLSFQVSGQVCGAEKCINLDQPNPMIVGAEVVVGDSVVPNPDWTAELANALQAGQFIAPRAPSGGQLGLWAGLSLALLAGLILNIMPCVLPVIPLRILSVVQLAGVSRRRYVTLALTYAGGILLFFVVLAAISAGLRLSTGEALNWGRHFQLAGVRVLLAMLMVAMVANLFGLFTVTLGGGQKAVQSRRRGAHWTSLGMGVMTAVLATPCSFALLVTTLAWAQGQSLAVGTLAVVMLGVGMAGPHAALGAFPSLVNKLPKAGRWTEVFKQAMGFLLLGVAVWLISTVDHPLPVLLFGLVLVFALWMWGTWVRYSHPLRVKLAIRSAAAVLAAVGGLWLLRAAPAPPIQFAAFDPAEISAASDAGRPVLVEFTARWCLSCQVLEHTVYRDLALAAVLKQFNVLAMKADVTDPGAARDYLYGRLKNAPPLAVLYPPKGGKPIFLNGEYGRDDLIKALESMAPVK